MLLVLALVLTFCFCSGLDTDARWATVFKHGQIDLHSGVIGPNNGTYVVARWIQNGTTIYGLAQRDFENKALGRFATPEGEVVAPDTFQMLIREEDGIFVFSWVPVFEYFSSSGLDPQDSVALPWAKVMPNGDIPLGHLIFSMNQTMGVLPTTNNGSVLPTTNNGSDSNASIATFRGVDCESGWVLVMQRVASLQIDLLPLDPTSAVTTSEDVEIISGDFYNQASSTQHWKWDVNYEAISCNSFTMPDLSRLVPSTFNAKELRRAWSVDKKKKQNKNQGKVDNKGKQQTSPPGPNNTLVTSTPEIITAAQANLPSVPLTDSFVLPPSPLNTNGLHETIVRVNRTFSSMIDVEPYTLMSAEARVTRVRITIPYVATQRIYDTNGVLLDQKKINGTYKSVSTVLSRITLREPNTPCDRGFYGSDGSCTQCPTGSTSPPRSRTIMACRCDTEGGYAGNSITASCTGCLADTYATSAGCLPCPAGCNSPPFSSHCDCTAALNIQASNLMRTSSAAAGAPPAFTAEDKQFIFAALIIFAICLIALTSFVVYLWRKQGGEKKHYHQRLSVHPHIRDDFYPTANTLSTVNSTSTNLFGRRTPPLLGPNGDLGSSEELNMGQTRVRPAFQSSVSQV